MSKIDDFNRRFGGLPAIGRLPTLPATPDGRIPSHPEFMQHVDDRVKKVQRAALPTNFADLERQIMAQMQDHKVMIDLHLLRAAKACGVPMSQVTPGQRQRAKEFNFLGLYGTDEARAELLKQLRITAEDVQVIFSPEELATALESNKAAGPVELAEILNNNLKSYEVK